MHTRIDRCIDMPHVKMFSRKRINHSSNNNLTFTGYTFFSGSLATTFLCYIIIVWYLFSNSPSNPSTSVQDYNMLFIDPLTIKLPLYVLIKCYLLTNSPSKPSKSLCTSPSLCSSMRRTLRSLSTDHCFFTYNAILSSLH